MWCEWSLQALLMRCRTQLQSVQTSSSSPLCGPRGGPLCGLQQPCCLELKLSFVGTLGGLELGHIQADGWTMWLCLALSPQLVGIVGYQTMVIVWYCLGGQMCRYG